MGAKPDSLAETQRSLGFFKEPHRCTCCGHETSSLRSDMGGSRGDESQRKRPQTTNPTLRRTHTHAHNDPDPSRPKRAPYERSSETGPFDLTSSTSSLPQGHWMKGEIGPIGKGSGLLGKPNYFDPNIDKELYPRPSPGQRLDVGHDYNPCQSAGRMGVMVWEKGRSHKTAAQVQREQRMNASRSLAGSSTIGACDEKPGLSAGTPILTPPKPPPWGFGGVPARVRAAHVDFYWGC